MNKLDQLIDQLEDMTRDDTFLDRLVMWACGLSAVACVAIVLTGN